MSPVENENSSASPTPTTDSVKEDDKGVAMPNPKDLVDPSLNYLIVCWDMDTTGRKLLDEICQVGGHFAHPDIKAETVSHSFSQYVMPYRNPNPGARRSFAIRVVNIGKYRMLKDMESGKILKTKSEVTAITDFIDWLKKASKESKSDGVILVCHEPSQQILIFLLLEALYKYNLLSDFTEVVKGFANSTHVAKKFGSPKEITSLSLRSLCKTVLKDTKPKTNSASDRSQVLDQILQNLCGNATDDKSKIVESAKVASLAVTVEAQELELKKLKCILKTQSTLRPIFESRLKQNKAVRAKAVSLRKEVAECGITYSELEEIFSQINTSLSDESKKLKWREELGKKATEISDESLDTFVTMVHDHFASIQ